MAVFSTNLIVYTHTDFEQTFLLEDNQSNSAKDLTGFTGTARFKKQIQDLSDPTAFNLSFPNRTLGKIRIGLTATQSANVNPGKYFYEILLKDSNDIIERVVEGTVIVKQPVTWPSPPPENPFEPQVP
tara:strand:+ start:332 stop:715 length:384 start_codon:yes stop_codon:yes gene_type:complete